MGQGHSLAALRMKSIFWSVAPEASSARETTKDDVSRKSKPAGAAPVGVLFSVTVNVLPAAFWKSTSKTPAL